MSSVINIAAYQFAELSDLVGLRGRLSAICQSKGLRGTILLSEEGINMFVAGSRIGVAALLDEVRATPGLAAIPVKESFSNDQPFNRMVVKIKKEIIAFGVDGIDPRKYTSKRIAATDLKRWLDEGRPVTLLDTRNDFEVAAGTFTGARAVGVDDFRKFPEAVEKLPTEMRNGPVVTFCTGGIRCEKAAPFLEQAGFRDVYQLDGGILKYFEECGGAHYDGTCFVFDKRVALDPALKAADLKQCFVCQAVLTREDYESRFYMEGEHCPRCYRAPEEEQQAIIPRRERAIREACNPLPGSIAYENVRPIRVPQRFDGAELLDCLEGMKTRLSRAEWISVCEAGLLTCRGEAVRAGRHVRAGEVLLHAMPGTVEPDVATDIRVLHEDEAIVVIAKPAPLPMHACGRFNRNTLQYLLNRVYEPTILRPLHRLDANTSGVVVFARSRDLARQMQVAFETGNVQKKYIARVHGSPAQDSFECRRAISDVPTEGGVRRTADDATGVPAHTEFHIIKRDADGTSFVEARPITGRTNQIRIHLAMLGHPIVGDPIYRPDGIHAAEGTLKLTDSPMCLHARSIELMHPLTKARMTFEAPPPAWAAIISNGLGTSNVPVH